MIRRGKRSRRKSARQELVNEADAWVRAIILQRQGVNCLKCEKPKPLQAAHILPKGHYPSMRFVLANVIGLCVGCHLFWAHKDPLGFTEWLDKKFPSRVDDLRAQSLIRYKPDLKEVIASLKAIYKSEEK